MGVGFKGAALPRAPLTLVVRMKLSPIREYQTFIGWGVGDSTPLGAEIRLSPEGNLEYGELSYEAYSTVVADQAKALNLTDGSWHSVAVVRKRGGETTLYVNGSLVANGTMPAETPGGLAVG